MKETYVEAAQTIEVYDKCDVLVVGSGVAGHLPQSPPRERAARMLCSWNATATPAATPLAAMLS